MSFLVRFQRSNSLFAGWTLRELGLKPNRAKPPESSLNPHMSDGCRDDVAARDAVSTIL